MSEAILKFTLPEEQEDFQAAVDGQEFKNVLWEIDQRLRSCLKHGHEYKTVDEALEAMRTYLHELLPRDL